MSSPKVSVIIPVYNTEAYVEQAVRSIMEQTLPQIEIIAINDGSTDGSGAILERLAEEDARIRFISQPNSGQAAARNNGLAQAHGEFIYFMDSDDWLEADALACCYDRCQSDNLDFAFFDAMSFGAAAATDPWFDYRRAADYPDLYNGCDLLGRMIDDGKYRCSVCLNLYRRTLIERANLRFKAGIIHEDELFTAVAYLEAQRVGSVARTFFHRRIRSSSTMTNRFSARNVTGYTTVMRELTRYAARRKCEVRGVVRRLITLLMQGMMLNAWVLPIGMRIRIAAEAVLRYPYALRIKPCGVLLFKKLQKR